MTSKTVALFVPLLLMTAVSMVSGKPPHILFIVADDLGWNDVGFRNPRVITPNIDRLAKQGMILNQSYVQPVCTPSRNSFMTGIYPFKVGLQNGVIMPAEPVCSPQNATYLPQKLKQLGYATHMLGKWHLGFCNWNCTPTFRGFDTFYGYYNGAEDYYTQAVAGGYDFRDGVKPLKPSNYSTFLYSDRAEQLIRNHDGSVPLFLYMAFQAVHSPLQVPEKYENMYSEVEDKDRRVYLGMVTAMDEAIGKIVDAMTTAGLLEETLILFTTDNGGMPPGLPNYLNGGGNNFPLRGAKTTVFEGGTRGSAFITGANLQQTGVTYDGLIHAVDWHSTLIGAAGGEPVPGIDGINHWDELRTGVPTKREELVYNLDDSKVPTTGHAAIRIGDFKLIQGFPGPLTNWYPPPEDRQTNNGHLLFETQNQYSHSNILGEGLYNLKEDPTEHHDVSSQYPDVVEKLKTRLDEYRKQYMAPLKPPNDGKSNPNNYGGFWTPGWC